MFGANTGVVQAGRYRMGMGDLARIVVEYVTAAPMQNSGATGAQRGGVLVGIQSTARSLDPVHGNRLVANEGMKQADGV